MSLEKSTSHSVHRQEADLKRKAPKDRARHDEKILQKKLHEIVSRGDIIMADPSERRVIQIPMRALENPTLRHGENRDGEGHGDGSEGVGDTIGKAPGKGPNSGAGNRPGEDYYEMEILVKDILEMAARDLKLPNLLPKSREDTSEVDLVFEDIRRKHTPRNLDIPRTFQANRERNAREQGRDVIENIEPQDYRVKEFEEKFKEILSAVVFFIADNSGSRDVTQKYYEAIFMVRMIAFLRLVYPQVRVEFIVHDTQAKSVNEMEFMHPAVGGGTLCSSALELMSTHIKKDFPLEDYNVYGMHFTDGENWSSDNSTYTSLLTEMLKMGINFFALIQVGLRGGLYDVLKKSVTDDRFHAEIILNESDVAPVIENLFS